MVSAKQVIREKQHRFTIPGIIRDRAAEHPDKAAITYQDTTLTYGELDERSNRAAQGLKAAGVEVQERVAFLEKNSIEYFDVAFGAAKLNAVTVAVNWRLAPPEILHVVNDSQAKVLFVGEEFAGAVEAVEDQLTTVSKIIVIGKHGRWEPYAEWIEGQDATDPGVVPADDDVAFQLYTSGTTGLPKGAMLTNANNNAIFANQELLDQWGMNPDTVNLVCMPLFHIAGGGWAMVGLYVGAHNILLRDVDPNVILEVIPKYGVTTTLFVPAVLQFMLIMPQTAETDFSTVGTVVYGASPITEEVLRASMDMLKCRFIQAYGLTETTGAICVLAAEDHDPENRPNLLRSCGKPFPWVELRVVDPDTEQDVATGEVGELWTRSGQNMKGYWNLPEATAACFTDDGWFKTGDAGFLDEEGYVYLHDRVKDMIVSGGENVYPAEIENVLMSHPGIADVAVVGVPDEKWGETVKAVVLRAEGSEVTSDEIVAFARERLAGYKIPRSVDFTDEPLPRNPSGKLLKRIIREPYWEGVERRIH